MKTLHLSRTLLAAIPLAGIALAAIPAAAAAAGTYTVHISAKLTVTHTAAPVCKAGICIIANHGTGTLTPYGMVTFTTVVTADGNQPPCGATSKAASQASWPRSAGRVEPRPSAARASSAATAA
jgi:hypothetical protein